MKHLINYFVIVSLCLFTAATFAIVPPKLLVTHNNTDYESNAFVAGTIPSQHPTKAHSVGKVFWTAVKLACFGHTENGKCSASIKMASNTPNPINVGTLIMDINTGEITPYQISANGFTVRVIGRGETEITAN